MAYEPKKPGRKPQAETPVVFKRHALKQPFAFWEEGILREWPTGPVISSHVELLKEMGAPLHEVD